MENEKPDRIDQRINSVRVNKNELGEHVPLNITTDDDLLRAEMYLTYKEARGLYDDLHEIFQEPEPEEITDEVILARNLETCKKHAHELMNSCSDEMKEYLLYNLLLELGGDQDVETAKKYVKRLQEPVSVDYDFECFEENEIKEK